MSAQELPHSTKLKVLAYLLVSFLLGGYCSFLLLKGNTMPQNDALSQSVSLPAVGLSTSDRFTICRGKGYNNIKPLSIEMTHESDWFIPLKQDLGMLVDSLKSAGLAHQISVYIREFDHRGWMAINEEERYHPASLMKVPLLISCLRQAEANPAMLKQEIVCEIPPDAPITPQFYPSQSIEPGKKYTVHELLYYMTAYSDNRAAWVLARHIEMTSFKRLFVDFCLPEPIEDEVKFTLTAKEISVFLKAIYTSSCLSPEFSEYAADLMGNCDFHEGLVKGYPKGARIWHKFGEWRHEGHDYELHESGVVFIKDKPFLITVMTKGNDTAKLAQCISSIANRMYVKTPLP